MKSFFDDGTYEEITTRLKSLHPNSKPLWGKMNSAQMLHHCQMPLNIILEHETYGVKPNWLINLLFKKSMYNDKPWRKNMPTAPGFKVVQDKDFDTEMDAILKLLNELHFQRHKEKWQPHPAFGKLTKEQWGQMQYKHLDHHLTQFGV